MPWLTISIHNYLSWGGTFLRVCYAISPGRLYGLAVIKHQSSSLWRHKHPWQSNYCGSLQKQALMKTENTAKIRARSGLLLFANKGSPLSLDIIPLLLIFLLLLILFNLLLLLLFPLSLTSSPSLSSPTRPLLSLFLLAPSFFSFSPYLWHPQPASLLLLALFLSSYFP